MAAALRSGWAARRLCDEFGALLVFDEVVTGFRLGPGGAQGYYGVRPDLTVLQHVRRGVRCRRATGEAT